MDDKTKSVDPSKNPDRMTGRSDEFLTGRKTSDEPGATDRVARQPAFIQGETTRGYSSSAPAIDEGAPARTREIRDEIDQTRKDMSDTVNAIQERLSPRKIAADAAESVKTAASDAVRDVADSETVQYVRANAVPTAMIGIGLAGFAWLAFSGREASDRDRVTRRGTGRDWRRGPSGYAEGDDYYRGSTPSSRQSFERHETANAYTPGLGYRSGESASLGGSLSKSFDRGGSSAFSGGPSRLERTLQASPLLVGAASMLIGAIIGMAIPETDRENELMGEARDNVVDGVQRTVRDTVGKVQEAASGIIDKVGSDDDKT